LPNNASFKLGCCKSFYIFAANSKLMNILILGSGGREHAFAHKIAQSPNCSNLFIAPGNAGTLQHGKNINLSVTDFAGIRSFCLQQSIEMVVVGPEEPLVKGIVDFFKADEALANIAIVGPDSRGAMLEGSKAFSKAFMQKYNVPTASYASFTKSTINEAYSYLEKQQLPIVLKADGLAAGKGVLICESLQDAKQGLTEMILEEKFGNAGNTVVIESFLQGIEVSCFVLSDGKNYVLLPEAKDYKRIGEADTGLNTGGMGAVSPVPFFNEALVTKIKQQIIEPTINGLQQEGIEYIGFIFIGLMVTAGGDPYVIEYNCRMGDPETEVVLPRLENDLVLLLQSACNKGLSNVTVLHKPVAAVATVAVSGGYPGSFEKGKLINGLPTTQSDASFVYHAGTALQDGAVLSNGGRVLVSVALASDIKSAVSLSHSALQQINFDGMYFRKDIGYEFKD
jgi:phosphoribosylamine---glycine ligase